MSYFEITKAYIDTGNTSELGVVQEMTNWLVVNKKLISIRAIETKLGCPSALQKAVSGKQPLPKKWAEALKTLVISMQVKNS